MSWNKPLPIHPDMPHEMQTAVNDLAYAMDKFWRTIQQIENSTGIDPRDSPWRITFVGALQAFGDDGNIKVKETVVGEFADVMHLVARTECTILKTAHSLIENPN